MTAGVATKSVVWFFGTLVRPFVRLVYRATLEGIENLPEPPYLLVANHSGTLAIAEIGCFAALWAERFGGARPIAGFAHPAGFRVWPLSRLMPALGAIPSTYEAAEAALGDGAPILVFPGGDHEALRPFWKANEVDFGGRVGFLRIAEKADVPIVPLGIRGSHLTAPPLLGRSRVMAWVCLWPKLVGAKRWTVTVLGLIGAALVLFLVPMPWSVFVAWLWLASPLTALPWLPSRIRMRIGKPLESSATLAEVEHAVQELVDA